MGSWDTQPWRAHQPLNDRSVARCRFQAAGEAVGYARPTATTRSRWDRVADIDVEAIDSAHRGINLVRARITQIERDLDSQAETRALYEDMVAHRVDPGLAADYSGWSTWQASAVDARELQAMMATVAQAYATAHKAVGDVVPTRLEFSGPGGRAVQVEHSVVAELGRDDPERLLRLMQAAARAQFGTAETLEIERAIVDADVVEEM